MRFRWFVLILGLLGLCSAAGAQTDVPPVIFTGPLSHPRYDDGGVYFGMRFVYMKTNRQLLSQRIGIRGINDGDGTISGTGIPNVFVGSGEDALNTASLTGPGTYQPGWDLALGYRFQSGVAVEIGWRHLSQAKYHAAASVIPPSFDVGRKFENTFLYAPVMNFPTEFAGNPTNIPGVTNAATFGIWNAASVMSIELTQRYDVYQVSARIPIWQTDSYRSYGLLGPRIAWIWDRFDWRTVDADETGNSGPDTTALYHNMVSNRMYGVHFGFGHDWFLGTTPIGALSFTMDLEAGLYANLVKANAGYQLADRSISFNRARRMSTFVPSLEARLGFKWYPWEGISVEVGYDVQAYFNTIASRRPVDFNVGIVDPEYDYGMFRWFYGLRFGVGFVF
jgi:hypothetical protein